MQGIKTCRWCCCCLVLLILASCTILLNMGPKIYHLKHTRTFALQGAKDPELILNSLVNWLSKNGFTCRVKSSRYAVGI